MQSIATKLPLHAIVHELSRIDTFWRDDSGAYMAIRPCVGIPVWLQKCEWIMKALEEISEIRKQPLLHVMINKLPPNTIVPIHTDTLTPTRQGKSPRLERWHLPILTNEDSFFWDEVNGWQHMALGSWWGLVPYWLNHSVTNEGLTERVHIVVDLDTPNCVREYEAV